jgi:hypothetical protein
MNSGHQTLNNTKVVINDLESDIKSLTIIKKWTAIPTAAIKVS